ncbi:MAG: hypothetical protein HN846_01885 [Candidatus Pacebacteria bacterium]|nr:hypothetical protein [Candidatus Paceibacterota bacterium]MBT3512013.1 hypothetical protein [Candidatus Paceibacterota bacterium]MBT4004865.1 hypothetical protein [Candidatus Paceibacterota bacterium]MBT4359044.1 hypothetical protein [Candidatus Paceibacterota bacterium]MBT6898891.1 hypothetical protein [Candidatus Paceibacterota bacterium]
MEFLDKEVEDRVNVVAEFGDLLHYWNDMFRLGDASITSLMSFFEIDAPANELTIARIKEAAAAVDHAEELVARDLLYELKAVLRLGEDDQIDAELIGVMASHIFAVATALDINPIYAVLMKNLRNRQKYRPWIMNVLSSIGLNYGQITKIMVRLWNGGDTEFFKKFLDQFPIELSYVVASQLATEDN